jgi:hypothetical protein
MVNGGQWPLTGNGAQPQARTISATSHPDAEAVRADEFSARRR